MEPGGQVTVNAATASDDRVTTTRVLAMAGAMPDAGPPTRGWTTFRMLAELTIFAADSVATARTLLAHDRLSDLLAADTPIEVRGVRLTSLEDGRRVNLDALDLERGEILLASTDAPRGNLARRVGTIQRPAVARVGPFEVTGQLHGPPSMDPFQVARRHGWFALTDATISYLCAGREVRTTAPVALVNVVHLASLVPDEGGGNRKADASPTDTGWPTDQGSSSAWR
jgi:hypothetical protein